MPEIAIDMHTDVMQWEEALNLADKLAPKKMAWLTREHAQQLEQTSVHSFDRIFMILFRFVFNHDYFYFVVILVATT